MTDDIVTNLRDGARDCERLTEAADEIERLRTHLDIVVDHNAELMAEIDSLKAILNGQFSSTSQTKWKRDE